MAFKSERHVARGQNFDYGRIAVGVRALEFCNYKPPPGEISAEYTSLVRGRVDEKSPLAYDPGRNTVSG
jgi:hypothetical protein